MGKTATVLLLLAVLYMCEALGGSRVAGAAQQSLDRIGIQGKWFVDAQHRVVQLRGINAVVKEPPWLPNKFPNDLTNDTHLHNLKRWGFNTVRFIQIKLLTHTKTTGCIFKYVFHAYIGSTGRYVVRCDAGQELRERDLSGRDREHDRLAGRARHLHAH